MVSKTPKRTGRRGKTESIDLSRREQDDEEENRKGEGLYRPEVETSKRKNPNGRNQKEETGRELLANLQGKRRRAHV